MSNPRVLFVDDEPRILDGLRRSLRGKRGEWEMAFVTSGNEALEVLRQSPHHVVVSDMRMPGMDGATLLAHVRERHPEAARVVLSGYTEPDSAIKVAVAGHRFLTKPAEATALVGVIEELLRRTSAQHHDQARRIAGGVRSLPSLPGHVDALRVFLLAPNVDPSDVVDASLHNVGLAAKLLQLSNSTFFRGRNHNSSIEVAVNCVGLPTVRGLTDVAEVLWPAPEHAVQYLAIAWRHAVATTYLVELMASPADRPCAQAAALLQDVGRLGCIASGSDPGESPVDLAAPDYGGVPFRDVGVDLLHLWGLPAQVVGAVAERDAYHRASASGLGVVGAVRAAHLLLQDTEAGDPLVGAYHDELAELLAHPQLRAAGIEWRQAAELASTRAFRWVPPSVAEPATPAEFEIEDGRGADLGR